MSTGPNEAFCSVYPNGFVKNSSWPVAQQGDPVVINGANTKYGPRLNTAGTAWDTSNTTAIMSNIKGSGGPTQFNTVRVNLDWGHFQYWNGSAAVVDSNALTELDAVIDAAITNNLYVILVPVHIRQPGGQCTTSGNRLYNGYFNVPRWAWDLVDPTLAISSGYCNAWPAAYDDKVDDALLLSQAQTYFRTLANRYSDYSTSPKAARSRQVIAFDLVNEMTADGGGSTEQDKVLSTYQTIITDLRANTTATKKIMIGEVGHGDTSLKQNISDLQALAGASSNIVMSFHDYFGGSTTCGGTVPTNATYGQGYSGSGFVTGQERTDGAARTYTCGTTEEKAQHQAYVNQMAGWFSQAQLPMYVGEYGVYNSCNGNVQSEANLYAQDTKSVYDNVTMDVGGTPTAVAVGRTWWSHGYATDGNSMELRRSASGCATQTQGTYFAHAAYL
ncbi:MAG: glycoside hydrolase family 5 protein [Aquihabitans sp.]